MSTVTCHDYAVFIGRFEPFHLAHQRVVEKALSQARQVILLIGSACKPRTTKDPFFYEERRVMIRAVFPPEQQARLRFAPLRDFPYNDERWAREVQAQVQAVLQQDGALANGQPAPSVCLVGHFKDRSSEYLRMFPQWKLVEAPDHEQRNATDIRTQLFEAQGVSPEAAGHWMLIQAAVPEAVHTYLRTFATTEPYAQLVREHQFIQRYRAQFASLKWPPVFVTADAVVVHSGHVLLVQRGAEPGKGLWALPGGFVDAHETVQEACLRELREETGLKLPEPVLRGSIRGQRVFDKPDRSARGRTITHAFHFDFPAGELPRVKGSDDAVKARWVPLAQFFDEFEPQMFEDHYGIVSAFLGV